MDWKLLLSGVVMMIAGGLLAWRFRKSKYASDLSAGCVMAFALILLMTGVLTVGLGFAFKA